MRTAFAIAGHTPPWPALGAAENPIPMTLRFLFVLVPLLAARLLAQTVPAPAILHSTYLGGSGPDYVTDGGLAIATGPGGTLYVLGQTSSASFPTTAVIGAQTNGYGTFIARFSPDGRTRLQTTFIGGIAARALAVDSTGSVYLTGETGGSLPGESSAQANFGGAFDAFVVKLNPAGTEVVYATYLGGSDLEIGRSLAVDNTGVAYVAGWTSSTNFPATPGAAQTAIGGNYDAFVAAINPDGKSLRYATYVGGTRSESGAALTLDGNNRVWLAGRSSSPSFAGQLAEPARTFGSSAGVTPNAYVARLSVDGSVIESLAFLAGDGTESIAGIRLDANGAPVVLGYTDSENLPTTAGSYQPAYRGANDLFVAKFTSNLDALGFCTYVGSPGFEFAAVGLYAGGYTVGDQFIDGTSLTVEVGGLALDPAGNVLLSASTGANEWPNAVTSAPNNANVMVAKLAADGSRLMWLSLLGGQTEDYGNGLASDGNGGAWITGEANRPVLPPYFPTTADAIQPNFAGGISDAILARLGDGPAAPANDAFAAATALAIRRGTVRARNVGATREAGEPTLAGVTHDASVWWTWTAPAAGRLKLDTLGSGFDTVLAAYTGTALAGLTEVASNDNGAEGTSSRIEFPVTTGTVYRIAISGRAGAQGDFALNLTFSEPPNDDFARRSVLVGFPVTATGSSRNATAESGIDASHGGIPGGQSVWWEWTSPTNGFVAISTAGSGFNTVLAVYTGDSLGALTEVKANDNLSDQPGAFASQVTFLAAAGTRYLIAVDGYFSQSGDIQLGIFPGDPPPNDSFANRGVLSGFFARISGANINATDEFAAGEPRLTFFDALGQQLEPPAGNTVWWTWTAPTNGRVRLGTSEVTFDTRLGVYTGGTLDALTRIAANNNRNGGFADVTSLARWEAIAGTTYQFALDGGLYGANSGRFTLTLILDRPPRIVAGSAQLANDGTLSFTVEAVPDSTLHLEASADLRAWTRLGNRVVTEPVFTWTTATAELPAPRFFRLVDDGAGE
jgi:hypothetical protein